MANRGTMLQRQKIFTRHLVAGFREFGLRGLSLEGACAVTGNASVENKVLPETVGPKDHGSDGTLQWRLARLDGPRGMITWTAKKGMDWNSPDLEEALRAQAAFTLWEMENGEASGDTRYHGLLRDLREGRKSIETLTANFCKIYERPNMRVAHLDLRIRHARSVFMIMSNEQKPSPSTDNATAGGLIIAAGAGGANLSNGGGDTSSLLIAVAAFGIWMLINRFRAQPAEPPVIDIDDDDDIIDAEPLQIEASEAAEFEAAKQAVEDTLLAHQKALSAFEAVKDRMQAEADEILARIREASPRKAPSKAVVKTDES